MKINGSLVFDASSASEIQNLRVQKYAGASVPVHGSAAENVGRAIYVTSTGGGYLADTLYIGSATAWVAIATGGNAAALQTEVDNLEASLGSIVGTDGVFVPGQVTGIPGVAAATSVQGILQAIADYANGNNTLAELDDVTLTALTTGDYLKYNGTLWVNDALTIADVTDITASAAELNVLDGIPATLTAVELGYVDGVTSPIQTQLNDKQPLNTGLSTLSTVLGDGNFGILVNTAANVTVERSLVAPAAGITITNPDGVAGNPTFALANDLGALEGLTTTGYIVRTGDGTATTRAIAGTAGNIVVTNGSGVASDTSLDLAGITQGATGSFLKFSVDGFGRVVSNTAVLTADITSLVDSQYLRLDGTTVMAANLNAGGFKVVSLATPTADTDAATKAYVDSLTNGLSWKPAVKAATTANITLSAGQTIDGVTVVGGDRVLVKNQTTASENGIYVVNVGGAWTRASDMDSALEFDGSAVFVQQGTANEGTGWTETLTVATVGTSPVAFSQFSGGQAFIWGVGLGNTGNTVFVNLGSGIVEKPSDSIGLDLFDESNSALILTTDGTTRENPASDNGQLFLLLQAGATGGLAQGTGGLRIAADGVTNAMLLNDSVTINSDGGTGSLALGGTLEVRGTSTQGITTSNVGSVFTVTASDASSSQKGVASFNATEFTVTAGAVALGTVPVAKLAANTISFAGTTGSDAVLLGETLNLSDGGTHTFATSANAVRTVVTANDVAISVREASTTIKGVASFAAADFSVAAAEVTLVPKSIDAATDVVLTSPQAGQTLVYNGTAFVNQKVYHLHTQSAAATTWTVTHNLGAKFANVTVVDDTDNVVIPQSIVFNTTSGLTVTFNTAITGTVIVMAVA